MLLKRIKNILRHGNTLFFLIRLSEVLGLVLKRQISLGKDVSMIGFGIYVDAIFSFLNLKPAQVSKGPKALPDAFPFSISRSVFDKFVPNG